MTASDRGYRADIDGLRAIAILGVIAYHSGLPGLTGGYVGVDVFFVISGYLITQLLVKEASRTGTISIAGFYARRFRRLLPALVVVVLFTVIVGRFVLPPTDERESLAQSSIASLLFVANHYFLHSTGGYFDGPSELKPLLHLWSLSVEEQFYLVWPLLLIALAKATTVKNRTVAILSTIVVLAIFSFALSVWLVRTNQSAAFFIAPSRAWELAAGAFIAVLPLTVLSCERFNSLIATLGVAMLLASYLLLTPNTRFPGLAAMLPVVGTALLIRGNALSANNPLSRLLGCASMVGIGKLSYGWYLWHWPLLAFVHSWLLMQSTVWIDLATCLIALLLAAITLRYVENPIRFGRTAHEVSTGKVLLVATGAMIACAVVALAVLTFQNLWPTTERERFVQRVASDRPSERHISCLIDRNHWDGTLPVERCTFGASDRPVDLVIWGDSHAMSWTPILDAPPLSGRIRYVQLTMNGCRPLAPEVIDRPSPACTEFRRLAMQYIASTKQLSSVVLAGRWPPMVGAAVPLFNRPRTHVGVRDAIDLLNPAHAQASADPKATELDQAIAKTFAAIDSAGRKTLVILDPAELKFPAAQCLYVHYNETARCGISHEYFEANFADVARVFHREAAKFARVKVIDTAQHFCSETACPAVIEAGEKTPIFYDTDHVTASAARVLGAEVGEQLAWLLPPKVGASVGGHD